MKDIYVGAEKCSQMVENWQFLKLFFLPKLKNIWIYVIAFAPIVIQTQQAPQNDHRNLSFVKGTIVVGNRMTRKGPNMTISTGCLFNFRTDFKLPILTFEGAGTWISTTFTNILGT